MYTYTIQSQIQCKYNIYKDGNWVFFIHTKEIDNIVHFMNLAYYEAINDCKPKLLEDKF